MAIPTFLMEGSVIVIPLQPLLLHNGIVSAFTSHILLVICIFYIYNYICMGST